jgi:hypothetical protein
MKLVQEEVKDARTVARCFIFNATEDLPFCPTIESPPNFQPDVTPQTNNPPTIQGIEAVESDGGDGSIIIIVVVVVVVLLLIAGLVVLFKQRGKKKQVTQEIFERDAENAVK